MVRDDYELMPEKELSSMKNELDELRKQTQNVDKRTGLPRETVGSIENLNKSINSLLGLFQTASEELKLEERDEALISKQLGPLSEKIDTLLDQNEKIAKAIIAIADMISENSTSSKKDYAEEEEMQVSKSFIPPKRDSSMGFPPPPPPSVASRGFPGFPPPPPREQMSPNFPPVGAPEPLPPFGDMGPMPDFGMEEDLAPKKKGLLGGLFKK